jgi:hypothetical protein
MEKPRRPWWFWLVAAVVVVGLLDVFFDWVGFFRTA